MRIGLACAALWIGATAYADDTSTAPLQLGPNTYVLRSDSPAASNAGFVLTANAVVLVDAPASPALALRLLGDIRRITPKPVSHVLITRFDAEHAGGLSALKAAGAAIVGRRPAQPTVEADAAVADKPPLFPTIDLALEDSTDLLIGGVHIQTLSVGAAPGAEGMLYFFPNEGVLFTGDLVALGRIPEVGRADTRRWIVLLDELLAFDAKVLVPGQGAPSAEPAAALQANRDYLAFLRESMADALRLPRSFDEAYERIDWDRFAELPGFDAVNRSNASATFLRMQRERD